MPSATSVNNDFKSNSSLWFYNHPITGYWYSCAWFLTKSAMERHLKTSAVFGKGLQKQKFLEVQNRRYICLVCDKKFSIKPTVRRHMKMHTSCNEYGTQMYMCVVCDKKFITKSAMKRHMKT